MDPLGTPSGTPRGHQTTLWKPTMDPLGNPSAGTQEVPEPHFVN